MSKDLNEKDVLLAMQVNAAIHNIPGQIGMDLGGLFVCPPNLVDARLLVLCEAYRLPDGNLPMWLDSSIFYKGSPQEKVAWCIAQYLSEEALDEP